ncbi:uncharacterized protein [Ptychodera flava]|uniref:uncharacterized protein isoform X2 n=1 Tax=Ptychodera flava TaxID=63121 RepID=UPI00396A7C26
MGDNSLRAAIVAQEAKHEELYDAGDAKGVSELYTEDCQFMRPGTKLVIGRQSVVDAVNATRAAGWATLKLTTDEVGDIVDGRDTAFESGQYVRFKADGSPGEGGKYLVVWKKVDGVYLIYLKCFNSN